MARSATDTSEKYRVQVLDRAVDILDALANGAPERGLGELAAQLSLHKSTTHRLLSALERHRLVERSSGTEYCLGIRLFELGMKAAARFRSLEAARPFLQRLSAETGETAHLGILRECEVISLVNAESHQALHTPSTVGRRTPAYCTSQGKAILAFAPDSVLAQITAGRLTALTAKTITSVKELRQELKRVRTRGYAVDDEEFETGLRCIGAPVRDHTGAVVAAISIAGPVFRVSRQRVPLLAREVMSVADTFSRTLGWTPASVHATHG